MQGNRSIRILPALLLAPGLFLLSGCENSAPPPAEKVPVEAMPLASPETCAPDVMQKVARGIHDRDLREAFLQECRKIEVSEQTARKVMDWQFQPSPPDNF